MSPELLQSLHEAVVRELAPDLLKAPNIIDWSTVCVWAGWEDPWSYSEYTAGGGTFSVRVTGQLIVGGEEWRDAWAAEDSFSVWRDYAPSEMAELFSRLVGL